MASHVQGEAAVGVDVCPEQRGETSAVFAGEAGCPGPLGENALHEHGVDVHQRRLQEVEISSRVVDEVFGRSVLPGRSFGLITSSGSV